MYVRLMAGLIVAAVGMPAWAQTAAATSTVPPIVMGGVYLGPGFGGVLQRNAVKGQPFSLVETTTTVRTGPDGKPSTRVVVIHRMRDAEGRLREEVGTTGVSFMLTDPVAPLTATVFPRQKMAMVTRYPAGKPPTAEEEAKAAELRAKQAAYRVLHPSPDVEELPGKMVAGVYAVGERRVQMMQGARVVTERWTSPDLKITVAVTTDDPRPQMATITTVVADLKRADPDVALFEIPVDYKLEEKQP